MTEWAQGDVAPKQVKQEKGPPFNQRIRINVFRVLGTALFTPALFIRPYFDKTAFGGFLEQIGIILSHLQNPNGTSRAKFSDLIFGDVSASDTSSGHLQHFSAATIQRQ